MKICMNRLRKRNTRRLVVTHFTILHINIDAKYLPVCESVRRADD